MNWGEDRVIYFDAKGRLRSMLSSWTDVGQDDAFMQASASELEMALPIGLVYDAAGAVVLDPDQQIQQSIQLLFDTFREIQSATAVVRRFLREGICFPRRIRRGIGKGDVVWGSIEHCRVIQILHNPRYAGAYVYGRTKGVWKAESKCSMPKKVSRENWLVLIRDAHPGYIKWEEFERNEQTLHDNVAGWSPTGRGRMPREGTALLQGRLLCGRCGARMRVRYQKMRTTPGAILYLQRGSGSPCGNDLSVHPWSRH
jgi:hypothetical protein